MQFVKSLLIVSSWMLVATHAHAGWFSSGKSDASSKHAASDKKPIPIISSVSSGTKKIVSNTTHIFASKKTPVRQSGTTAIYSSKPKADKPGFFKSMFSSEPPPPKTIKEWMKLKQIHP